MRDRKIEAARLMLRQSRGKEGAGIEAIDCSVCWVSSAVVSRARSLASTKHGALDISGSLTNSIDWDLEEDFHVDRGIMSCM